MTQHAKDFETSTNLRSRVQLLYLLHQSSDGNFVTYNHHQWSWRYGIFSMLRLQWDLHANQSVTNPETETRIFVVICDFKRLRLLCSKTFERAHLHMEGTRRMELQSWISYQHSFEFIILFFKNILHYQSRDIRHSLFFLFSQVLRNFG